MFHDFYHSRFPAKEAYVTLKDYVKWLNREGRLTPAVADAVNLADDEIHRGTVVFYIAGALTGASEEEKERYVKTSEIISTQRNGAKRKRCFFGYAPHIYGTDPKKHPHVTPQEVRDIDYLWAVVMAEAHVNFLDPIAHGNAIEEGWAEASHIPAVMCIPEGMRVSRLTRGMINIDTFISYKDIQEAYEQLSCLVDQIHDWLDMHPGLYSVGFFAERSYLRKMAELNSDS